MTCNINILKDNNTILTGEIMKKGFTLAETLITLGIIGIVAAMTIPTLKAHLFEKQIVNKFKQSYSIINNAVRLMEESEDCQGNSCYDKYEAPEIEAIASNIDRHFKYSDKKCYLPGNRKELLSWLPKRSYALDGTNANYSTYSIGANLGADKSGVCYYKLYNGAVVAMSRMNAFGNSGTLNIVIDANGKSAPNRVGKDMFPVTSFGDNYNLVPYYKIHTWSSPYFYKGLCNYQNAKSCKLDATSPAAYVLTYDKLPDLEKAGFPKKP